MLYLGAASIAQAGCVTNGNIINCTGDLPAGAIFSSGNKTLDVRSLTSNPGGAISLNGSAGNASGHSALDGDSGGSGTTTVVTYDGDTYTAPGLVARANGGNGASGLDGTSFFIFVPVPIPIIVPGGDAGHGGAGGSVTVNSEGDLSTSADNNHGILAQANGGNGGNGGDEIAVLGAVGLAGDGGQGGVGGSVNVTTTGGTITTQGKGASGIYAESNGGVGGRGGSVKGVAGYSDGGDGASPKAGGTVTVNNAADIETHGKGGVGIFTQSIGGYAGSGGSAVGIVSYAGSGASAGDGGTVSVGNSGSIHTRQADAHGIFAQSVGGGGGAGGSGGGVVSLGGSGGHGGAGKLVTVTNLSDGAITTDAVRSVGILAQSIGGGGGDGGDSGGLISIGGNSTGGGTGGVVIVSNAGTITTNGNSSQAILAQSIGGGGGNGGTSGGMVTVGGVGGGGGTADTVTVNNSGKLETFGKESTALLAQSVGGGGGNGGGSFSGSAFVSFALGGTGGKGGDGKKATVNLSTDPTKPAEITTHGDRSNGVTVQSVGGGGGNGGGSVSAAVGYSGSLSIAVGGKGGDGGQGGQAELNGTATVNTSGENADGILVQSVGGGGGNGGYAISVSLAGGETAAIAGAIGVGGSAGKGGAGDLVTVNAGGTIKTTGEKSEGLIVQSVGGGGGTGGYSITVAGAGAGVAAGAGTVGVGGSGGDGGKGGVVNATYTGNVTTEGNESDAVIIQSVGGGGGNGGFTVGAAISGSGTGAGAIAIGVGGSGGTGGHADTVTGKVIGNIQTGISGNANKGAGSNAFVVQSVGGGGGNGGFSVAGTITGGQTGAGAVSIGVGGTGGGGGNAGVVTGTLIGNATTYGKDAAAVLVQSVGGGGGNGGFAVAGGITAAGQGGGTVTVGVGGSAAGGGYALKVTADVSGDIKTTGAGSTGFTAQSIGGGGGNGGFAVSGAISLTGKGSGAVSVGVGGSGGTGGAGGEVDAGVIGKIETDGDNAVGYLAQSLGGGGGNGGFSVAGAISIAGEGSGAVAIGIGGSGGSGGNAGFVTADQTGNITTLGKGSDGFVAQSLGGGGGNGGFNVSGGLSAASKGSGVLSIGIGGMGGGGGNSDKVTATVDGNVSTDGAEARGVVVQSIGGGGGNGGFNVSGGVSFSRELSGTIGVGVGGFGGGAGHVLGKVTATVNGDIDTDGAGSTGLIVQSLGGGGGNGGFNVTGGFSASAENGGALGIGVGGFAGGGGNAGEVLSNSKGNITTDGAGAKGAVIQSLGGSGGNGGVNVTGNVSLTGGKTGGAIGVGIGGFGGSGGTATFVNGKHEGNITTQGKDADGIVVQSVGGGGGNGGINVTGTLSASVRDSGAFGFGLGGFGGNGGKSDAVNFNVTGDIITHGDLSDGVTIQSIGGGGGNGALNVSGSLALSFTGDSGAASIGIGGFGGKASDAGSVTSIVTGRVIADGSLGSNAGEAVVVDGVNRWATGSHGVMAQSIGGGGGNGGINISGAVSGDLLFGKGYAASFGLGGFGGGGGNADFVNLTAKSPTVFQSTGDYRSAVTAQSIGGGGGNGAINVSGSVTLNGQLTAGVGGFGGDGGFAKRVDANVEGKLIAKGVQARGLVAQSIGGGGGDGAINISGGINLSSDPNKPSLVFGLGGFGGDGGTSGIVDVKQKGEIEVEGTDSIGILVQSIAGGGGSGGLNVSGNLALGEGYSAALGIGGNGGDGDNAADVILKSDGQIIMSSLVAVAPGSSDYDRTKEKYGERGGGILAQSIGGGGGVGGLNVSGVSVPKGNPIVIGVGGSGGAGGNAGSVTIDRGLTTEALVQTKGDEANGITAQSIGGGGGNAGMNIGISLNGNTGDNDPKQLSIAIGGQGGAAGIAGNVTITNEGDVHTYGKRSDGIFAQSIGGGGGNANINVIGGLNKSASGVNLAVGGGTGDGGKGGVVKVDHTGDIITEEDDSTAIFAQSVGGGGGNTKISTAVAMKSKNALNVGIGRMGGTGADGGMVTVLSDGTLKTIGDRAIGIIAQSVGGGGGMSGTIAIGVKASQGSGDDVESGSAGIQVGLKGGDSGVGGEVLVETSGSITTEGEGSHAILAQSVGGGGGIGGGVFSPIIKENFSARVGVGGEGGTGSDAGIVTVHNKATLTTTGNKAAGILAQSTGGGGGTGGQVIQVTLSTGGTGKDNNTGSVNVGGKGGEGANGKKVWVTNNGLITTTGKDSFGIQARSVGGGGGDGGLVFTGTLAYKGNSNSLELNVGGEGGKGGTGGMAEVLNEGTIWTKGEGAVGIQALSLGGGGGDAGLVANLSLTIPGEENSSKRLLMNIGGRGGEGGVGGEVKVTNQPDDDDKGGVIKTEGNKAHGIFAQSIGGGGGNGGSVVSLNFAGTGKNSALIGLNIGGIGGKGNIGGTVNVINEGKITTTGNDAYGIFAQSIGGGGGNGGIALAVNATISSDSTAPVLALGGQGGSGGKGGLVHVDNKGEITTTGKNSHGIVAQSIGGGGGNANVGIGIGGLSTFIANPLSFALGAACTAGGCASGGDGGKVIVDNTGTISVTGEGAQAIKAESLNGGGGSFVIDFTGITSIAGGNALPSVDDNNTENRITKDPVVTLMAGGDRTSNNTAGAVTINTTGANYVQGNYGVGTGVQAVGGGGGNIFAKFAMDDETEIDPLKIMGQLGGTGGSNNKGGDVTESGLKGEVGMFGDLSTGLFIQSIGGGGGRSTIQLTTQQGMIGGGIELILGGINGSDAGGGDITLTQDGLISTTGKGSFGSIVQSVGGGGGYGTFNLKATPPAIAAAQAPGFAAAALPGQSTASLTFGANGGSQLNGGDVDFTKTGNTVTTDDLAVGLFKQSVGAGGGVQVVLGVDELTVNFGGTSSASGAGGAVKLNNTGIVQTAGQGAHGIFLQSVGGGGGFLTSDAGSVVNTLRDGNTGNGGEVTLDQIGDVITKGNDAFGVIAQSIGGGGGFIQGLFAGSAGGTGNGGAITLDLNGSVVVDGQRSTAVFAQSVGDLGGNIEVELTAGKYAVGGTLGTAIKFDGGAANTFTNDGYVFTKDEIKGYAMTGTLGNDAILNNLYMAGIVDLGTGANSFTNAQVARFDMGDLVNLNNGQNLLLNKGIVAPGGTNSIATVYTTQVNGAVEQSTTGFYEVDLDFVAGNAVTGNTDRINATGTAALKGTVDLKIVNPTQVSPGYHEVTILSADGGVTDKSLILKAPPSAVAQYDILYPNPDDVVLSYDIDFSGGGSGKMNDNQTRLGDYINRLQVADSKTRLAPLVGYIFLLPTIEDLRAAYAMLTPEAYASNLAATLTAIDDFGQALLSCRKVDGEYRFVAQSDCGWVRASGRTMTYDSSFEFNGYREDVFQIAGGFQERVGENEFLGLGFSYESSDADMPNLAKTVGDRIQLGLVAKTRMGGTTAAGSVIVGSAWYDTDRVVNIADLGGETDGKQTMSFTAGRIQLAQAFDYENSYFRLGVDGVISAIFQDDFREEGGGLANLAVDEHDNVNGFVMPFVELGGETSIDDGAALFRAWSRLALVQYIDPDTKVYAGLIGAAEGVDSFYADAGFDSTLGRLELGLDVLSPAGAVIGLSGAGVLGEDTEIYQGNVKATIPF